MRGGCAWNLRLAFRASAQYGYVPVKHIFKAFFLGSAFLAAGCSHQAHEGKLVYKGKVARVDFELSRGVTVIHGEDGKTTELEGLPGIPCAEVEIYQHGHEYEVFQAPRS